MQVINSMKTSVGDITTEKSIVLQPYHNKTSVWENYWLPILLPNALTARVIVLKGDQNNEIYTIIKVATGDKHFS